MRKSKLTPILRRPPGSPFPSLARARGCMRPAPYPSRLGSGWARTPAVLRACQCQPPTPRRNVVPTVGKSTPVDTLRAATSTRELRTWFRLSSHPKSLIANHPAAPCPPRHSCSGHARARTKAPSFGLGPQCPENTGFNRNLCARASRRSQPAGLPAVGDVGCLRNFYRP